MNLHKMIEICLKDDNMHIFVMINALICINNYVITCINSKLSRAITANIEYIICQFWCFCNPLIISFLYIGDFLNLDII